jgi:hypothetical protein
MGLSLGAMEWFVIVAGELQILGIFNSLLETLSWRTDTIPEKIHIQRIREVDGVFTMQKIHIAPHLFLKKVDGLILSTGNTQHHGEKE